MKTKCLFAALLAGLSLPMGAQETYENMKLIDNDLNGTARYVGMGGAMEALGADISTISTNPAGIGLFRHHYISTSFGLVSQSDAKKFSPGSTTNMSFDQGGFVYSMRSGRKSFLNVAFNYHKSRNFDWLLDAADELNNASQNKLTYEKYRNDVFKSKDDATYSQVDHFYMSNLLYNKPDDAYYYYPSTGYTFNRAQQGYIGEYDFNVSGNINDRVFLGLTLGVHDVHYRHYSEYTEKVTKIGDLTLADSRRITGTGVDMKLGAIFRPIADSPFRIGVYVQTPTWYDLTTKNYSEMGDGQVTAKNSESYDFKLYTPWKFGVSLGHTVGDFLALGATYEYSDMSSMDTRINDGDYYYDDWYGNYESSSSDDAMNHHTEKTLKGVSTVKLGMEFKPIKDLALRFGYNYISPAFDKYGAKDGTVWSPGSYYASSTDYVNWKDTNRFTVGIGYNMGKFNLDLAYQLSTTNGDFHPFMNYYDDKNKDDDNIANAVKVSNKRNQVLFTLGYRF